MHHNNIRRQLRRAVCKIKLKRAVGVGSISASQHRSIAALIHPNVTVPQKQQHDTYDDCRLLTATLAARNTN